MRQQKAKIIALAKFGETQIFYNHTSADNFWILFEEDKEEKSS